MLQLGNLTLCEVLWHAFGHIAHQLQNQNSKSCFRGTKTCSFYCDRLPRSYCWVEQSVSGCWCLEQGAVAQAVGCWSILHPREDQCESVSLHTHVHTCIYAHSIAAGAYRQLYVQWEKVKRRSLWADASSVVTWLEEQSAPFCYNSAPSQAAWHPQPPGWMCVPIKVRVECPQRCAAHGPGFGQTHPGNTPPSILIPWKNEINTSKPTFFPATKPDSGTSVSLLCVYHYFLHIGIWMVWELLNNCFRKRHTLTFPGFIMSSPIARQKEVSSQKRVSSDGELGIQVEPPFIP